MRPSFQPFKISGAQSYPHSGAALFKVRKSLLHAKLGQEDMELRWCGPPQGSQTFQVQDSGDRAAEEGESEEGRTVLGLGKGQCGSPLSLRIPQPFFLRCWCSIIFLSMLIKNLKMYSGNPRVRTWRQQRQHWSPTSVEE